MNNGNLRNLMKSVNEKYLDEAFADSYNNMETSVQIDNKNFGIKLLFAAAVLSVALIAVMIPFFIKDPNDGIRGTPDNNIIITQPNETENTEGTKNKETGIPKTESENQETVTPETTISNTFSQPAITENNTVPEQPKSPSVTISPETPSTTAQPDKPVVSEWTIPSEKPKSLYEVTVSEKMMESIISVVTGEDTYTWEGGNSASTVVSQISNRKKNLKLLAAFSGSILKGEVINSTGNEDGKSNTYRIKINKIYKDNYENKIGDEIEISVTVDRAEMLGKGAGKEVIIFADYDTDKGYFCTYNESICFKNRDLFFMISGQTFFNEAELQEELID